jgi:MoaA/NifB/PqqE/SkfB family radical SAM enzyme
LVYFMLEFNSFNSNKLFAQYHRWSEIRAGSPMPVPSCITIDPISACNLDCRWCNARNVLQRQRGAMIGCELLSQLPEFLQQWRSTPFPSFGCSAVCIAGGGEPLLHPNIDILLIGLQQRAIKVGLITNGVFVDDHIAALRGCHFVGVSMDAGTALTYEKIKGTKADFHRAVNGIKALVAVSNNFSTVLSQGSGRGVGYKFLILPENVHELAQAADVAHRLGCSCFQARPADCSYSGLTALQAGWDTSKLDMLAQQIAEVDARAFQEFPCYIVTDKFDGTMERLTVPYDRCVVGAMTAVISPSRTNGIQLSFCCDRRGDPSLVGIEDTHDLNDIAAFWGSERHWSLLNKINTKVCPRCTCLRYLDIYYKAILDDSMTVDLI